MKGQSNKTKTHYEQNMEVVMEESRDVHAMVVKKILRVDEKLNTANECTTFVESKIEATTRKLKRLVILLLCGNRSRINENIYHFSGARRPDLEQLLL